MTKKIALIDGYGFVFRAFHSLPPLTRADKTPVGAVYGFTNMLIKLLASLNVSHLGVVFDAGSKTFRNEIYPDYKANRPPCPEELIPQFPIVREAAKALNLCVLEQVGVEADDIIATLAKRYSKNDYQVLIVSSDKDLMQLVDDNVLMYDAMKNRFITEKEVEEKFMVKPNQVLDLLSLIGDSSDNVPGVKGIGVKTAAELINEFKTLDKIFENLDKIPQKKRKEYLENGRELAKLSKELITLKEDVEINLDEEDLKVKNIDPEKLVQFLQNQGFRSLVERVKKEFNFSEKVEKISENNKELPKKDISKQKLPNFSEIKKYKIENENDFLKIISKIKKSGLAIIDFEQNLEKLEFITISTLENDEILKEVYFLELKNKQENSLNLFNFEEKNGQENQDLQEIFIKNLKEIIENDSIKKIFFDAKKFMNLFYELTLKNLDFKAFEDISVMNHLLNSAVRNNFLELVDKNFNENFESQNYQEIYKEIQKNKHIFQDFTQKQEYYSFKNYSLLKLYKIFITQIYESKLSNSYFSFEIPLLQVLSKMEIAGIEIDIKKLQILSKEFEEKIQNLTKEIYKIAGEEFNIASTQQLSKILFEKMGLDSSKKSKKTGALSTKSSVLEELSFKGNEIADKILEFRHYSKLRNTYTEALPKSLNQKTKRIHTSFSTINTITGRLTSSEPNLQNIPIKTSDGRKIRECFIAKENHLLISADYSQIELRVIAHVAKMDSLIKAFQENKDIHKITAAQVFKVAEDEVSNDLRSKAKAINFGIIYGISAFGLAKQLKISRSDAAEYIKNYFATYPGIQEYMQNYQDFARQNGFITTISGRKCFLHEINSKNPVLRAESERLAINAPIQGSAAEIIKKAMIKIDKKFVDENIKAKILLQIHDELIIEANENEAEKIAGIVKKEMENAIILDCPLKVDVEIAKNWN